MLHRSDSKKKTISYRDKGSVDVNECKDGTCWGLANELCGRLSASPERVVTCIRVASLDARLCTAYLITPGSSPPHRFASRPLVPSRLDSYRSRPNLDSFSPAPCFTCTYFGSVKTRRPMPLVRTASKSPLFDPAPIVHCPSQVGDLSGPSLVQQDLYYT